MARREAKRSPGSGVNGAIILDILNLIGRFFKFGMETKQFPSPSMRRPVSVKPFLSSFLFFHSPLLYTSCAKRCPGLQRYARRRGRTGLKRNRLRRIVLHSVASGGRKIGLKIRCPQGRVGSTPSSGTKLKVLALLSWRFVLFAKKTVLFSIESV